MSFFPSSLSRSCFCVCALCVFVALCCLSWFLTATKVAPKAYMNTIMGVQDVIENVKWVCEREDVTEVDVTQVHLDFTFCSNFPKWQPQMLTANNRQYQWCLYTNNKKKEKEEKWALREFRKWAWCALVYICIHDYYHCHFASLQRHNAKKRLIFILILSFDFYDDLKCTANITINSIAMKREHANSHPFQCPMDINSITA